MKNPDKEHGNNNPSTIPQTPYTFGVRTQKRLLEASELVRYYITIGCRLTVLNTVYATVIRSCGGYHTHSENEISFYLL
eukprot:8991723-Ditylum_brightwellii.AAC.1